MSEANTPRDRPAPADRRDQNDVDVERGADTPEDRTFKPSDNIHAPDGEAGGSGREANPETDTPPRGGGATSDDLN